MSTVYTRETLFREAADIISKTEDYVEFANKNIVIAMYYSSANILHVLEEVVNSNELMDENWNLKDRLIQNFNEVNDAIFVSFIRSSIETQMSSQAKKRSISYKENFRFLVKAIAEYQERIINEQYIGINDSFRKGERPQTFLSYAYYDKGLSLSLFCFFFARGGFLYVNGMWKGTNSTGTRTKNELEDALSKSAQLLFLRTANSELHLRGNNSIRQWCSWEIGNFYTKNQDQKYYTNFYDKVPPRNDILDSFNPMRDVVNGRCVK